MKYFPVEKKYGNILTHTETKETSKLSPFGFRTPNAFAC